MTKDFDSLILKAKEEKENTLKQMESIKEQFILECIKFSQEWVQNQAKSQVKANADLANDLGIEKLKELKEEVNNLIDEMSSLIRQYLNKEELWWHTNEDEGYYFIEQYKIPDKYEKQIRYAFGELGIILSKYGIVKVSSDGSKDDYKIWAERKQYGGYGKPMYPYSIEVSKSMIDIMNRYIEKIKEAQEKNKEIKRLTEEKKKSDISELWDSL